MMQVLLVDDSPLMRRYVSRTLEMTGIDVAIHEAENGKQAIERAVNIRPNVIITDLNMPEMSGEELVLHVRNSPDLKDTPVLVLSADRSALRPLELSKAGAVAYLTKPVSPETLRETLMNILEAAN